MKRKLSLQDLSVISFSTEDVEITEKRGTVKGMATSPPLTQENISCIQQFTCNRTDLCSQVRTCHVSCNGTCLEITCAPAACF
jgi:hypothetical protein